MEFTQATLNTALKGKKTILIDFFADWCGPCQMMAPVFEQLEQEYPDIIFGKVNVEQEPELAGAFGIESIPTLVLTEGTDIKKIMVGFQPKEELRHLLEEVK